MSNRAERAADNASEFLELILTCYKKETLKKIVFSRPKSTEVLKVSGRLCAHRGSKLIALEYSLPGNTVSQKKPDGRQYDRDALRAY